VDRKCNVNYIRLTGKVRREHAVDTRTYTPEICRWVSSPATTKVTVQSGGPKEKLDGSENDSAKVRRSSVRHKMRGKMKGELTCAHEEYPEVRGGGLSDRHRSLSLPLAVGTKRICTG